MGDYRDEREAALLRAETLAQENARLQAELDAVRGGTATRSPPTRATTRMPVVIGAFVGAMVLMGAGAGFFMAARPAQRASVNLLALRGDWSPPVSIAPVALRDAVRSNAGTWAVGDRGTVLYRGESGAQWTAIPSGTDATLRAIVGGDPLVVVGDRGVALRFDMGQRRWIAEDTGTTADLHDIAASGDGLLVAGAHGTVLRRSGDGRWSALDSHTTADLYGIVVSATSYAVTAVGDSGTIVSGPTSGSTLQPQASPVHATLRAVAAWNGTLLAVGDGGTMVTTADRSPWVVVPGVSSADLFVAGTTEVPYEERRDTFSGSGSNTGFFAAGAGGTVLVDRLGSDAQWRSVRTGGAAIRATSTDPWTFFTDGGTTLTFAAR